MTPSLKMQWKTSDEARSLLFVAVKYHHCSLVPLLIVLFCFTCNQYCHLWNHVRTSMSDIRRNYFCLGEGGHRQFHLVLDINIFHFILILLIYWYQHMCDRHEHWRHSENNLKNTYFACITCLDANTGCHIRITRFYFIELVFNFMVWNYFTP